MKKVIMTMLMALGSVLLAQEATLSLADARGKIADLVANPSQTTALMKKLSAADQKAFVASLNEAVSKLPGSSEEKTAKFLALNEAALKGALPGNVTALLAEVFATVPPESLAVLNERFASDLFNRATDPSKLYTDAQMTTIAKSVVAAVQARTASADGAAVRNTMAILMMLRAANGTPADLQDSLLNELNDEAARQVAKNEWIGPALGGDYEPMLGAVDAAATPNPKVVLDISGPMALEALMVDLAKEGGVTGDDSVVTMMSNPVFEEPENLAITRVPRTRNPELPYNPDYRRGEPTGYDGQTASGKPEADGGVR